MLSRYRFSTQGAAQLHADLAAVCRVVDKHVGTGVAEAGLAKCLEGVKIVGLPVKGNSASQVDTAKGRDDDGGEDEVEYEDTDQCWPTNAYHNETYFGHIFDSGDHRICESLPLLPKLVKRLT